MKSLHEYVEQAMKLINDKNQCPVDSCDDCFIYSAYMKTTSNYTCTDKKSYNKAVRFIKKYIGYVKNYDKNKIKNKCISIW